MRCGAGLGNAALRLNLNHEAFEMPHATRVEGGRRASISAHPTSTRISPQASTEYRGD